MSATKRYDTVAIALHWAMAAAILGLLAMGFVMTAQKPGSPLQFQLYQMHKSFGALVLVLTAVRLGWRLGHRPPPLPAHMAGWERRAAHAGHHLLYLLMLALPLAGWVVVSTSPFNIPTLLFGTIPLPHLPLPRDIHGGAKLAHAAGAWIMIAALVAHVGAALRHHIMLGDDVMRRMLPRFGRKQ
ncbi:cytochrome b [Magnetospirillum sp. SS-4]|uniref:cytochrome b n=1 Tax=Magnetospirillum sp. SS-4 TaxID=2681465 RepID=UPI00137C878E|nr:cytochrome b [Magnetospirillum sp. SS-4]CAA7627392.1 Cytochrome B561 [Magnetospirillum sp. SS-4]